MGAVYRRTSNQAPARLSRFWLSSVHPTQIPPGQPQEPEQMEEQGMAGRLYRTFLDACQ